MKEKNETKKDVEIETKGNRPEKKFRSGPISVAVWKNEAVSGDEKTVFRTATFERTYMDSEKEFQTTKQLRRDDIPRLQRALDKEYDFICQLQEE